MAKAVANLSLIGMKPLIVELDKLQRRVKRRLLKKALKKASKLLVKETQHRVPTKTGTLRKSITVKYLRSRFPGDARAIVGPERKRRGSKKDIPNDGWYGFLVEFGFTLKKGKRGPKQKVIRKIPRRPFLRPAFDANVNKMMSIMAASLRKDLYGQ